MRQARTWVLVGLFAMLALPLTAKAAQRPFIWAYDSKIVPSGELELEQWLWARGRAEEGATGPTHYWIWWAPVFGLSDHFELALPFQIAAQKGEETYLDSFELDARYRIKPRLDTSAFQPLIRLAYHFPIHAGPPRLDFDLVGSYDFDSGLHAVLDLGGKTGLAPITAQGGDVSLQGTVDAGLAYPVSDEVQLGGEAFFELPIANIPGSSHAFVGPDFAWTRGRIWLTVGVLVGLTPLLPQTPHIMPRILWAVSL